LLKLKILVGRNEDVEVGSSQPKQIAVFDALPTCFCDGDDLVPGKNTTQAARKRLVKQNAHAE
jgi:hypothetical protein